MKKYFYKLLAKYVSFYLLPNATCIELNAKNNLLQNYIKKKKQIDIYDLHSPNGNIDHKDLPSPTLDYLILNGNIHFESDIQLFLQNLRKVLSPKSRLILLYYSSLWRPLIQLVTWLKLRPKLPEQNWFSPSDLKNFSILTDFEIIHEQQRIIFPLYIPLLSNFLNRWITPLPIVRWFAVVNVALIRPIYRDLSEDTKLSVSVIVPARNEQGNIEQIVQRFPKMSDADELIFVEGNSTDQTWEEIKRIQLKYEGQLSIKIAQQDGKGKGDAVRKGFMMASKDILMILDADITVPPEDLPKFYEAIAQNKGEFINGSRMVYPMENEAMRFYNLIGNKFFSLGFSFVLGQALKDTLCGTKVVSRENYLRIAANRSYFGEFDPFGDFDLLLGASRLGLKIVEIPITYRARSYGQTNIQRWKHGVILLRMLLFAAVKIRFL